MLLTHAIRASNYVLKISHWYQFRYQHLRPKRFCGNGFQNDPAENPINLNSLNFDPKNHNPSDQKFLDLLRDSEDSGNGSQPSANEDGGTPILSKSGTGSGHGSHGRQQKFRDRYYKTDFVITQLL